MSFEGWNMYAITAAESDNGFDLNGLRIRNNAKHILVSLFVLTKTMISFRCQIMSQNAS